MRPRAKPLKEKNRNSYEWNKKICNKPLASQEKGRERPYPGSGMAFHYNNGLTFLELLCDSPAVYNLLGT